MSSVAEIIEWAHEIGAELELVGEASIRVRGPRHLLEQVRERKDDFIFELRKREIVLVAARLLRERRWAVEPPICSFHIGAPGGACRRCSASWLEHYS